jgi:SAM-dependent methyltransferase
VGDIGDAERNGLGSDRSGMTGAAEWTGPVGDVWAAEWRRTDRCFTTLADELRDAAIGAVAGVAAPRIVDIGCGAGATSLALAGALPDARVIGIDISPGLVGVATERAAAIPNLCFEQGPVEALAATHAPVDLFVSRHGVMFFADPVGAFGAIRAAAAPTGRLVFSCFRAMALNPWASELLADGIGVSPPAATRAAGPFAFADPDHVRALLAAAGWQRIEATPVDFAYRAGGGADPVADALSFFGRIGPAAALLRAAPQAERDAMIERITAILERHRSGDTVDFPGAAWLWSAHNAAGVAP